MGRDKKKSVPTTAAFLAELDKRELHQLADRLLVDDREAIEECVRFLESDSRGFWHNRARALMARRLKHCTLDPEQQSRLSAAILKRLSTGNFTEQFKDQLRLALRLDPSSAFAAARTCLFDSKSFVRRYAAWMLQHERNA